MAGIPIPQEMLPRMDWHAEHKSAAWEHFMTRMKLYYTVAHTKEEAKVDTILFFAGAEATDRWKTLKEQLSADDCKSSEKVFTAFANSFKKSSSHWQAREEYLGDIKQSHKQTTAKLDIYIKGPGEEVPTELKWNSVRSISFTMPLFILRLESLYTMLKLRSSHTIK